MTSPLNRRSLLTSTIAASAVACSTRTVAAQSGDRARTNLAASVEKPKSPWPVWDSSDAQALLDVLNSGHWGRNNGTHVARFEERWRETMKARFCIATSSGTTALMTALGAINLGPGDEVILPPYTFVATFNVITSSFALPVFVDSDLESFQIDAQKISAAITPNTKLMLPVHIGGTPMDLDALTALAAEKGIPFIEDACQAALAVWRAKPVGTHGLGGCFSFQASKNLTAGEGGAVVTNNETFAHQCYNFHTPGGGKPAASMGRGSNYRMTEFQGGLLLAQLARLEAQARRRDENAKYLSEMLAEIPGIQPAKLYDGCERSAWHLYMFRYDKSQFEGLARDNFLRELRKEGIGASGGYSSLNKSTHVTALASNPHYQRIYGRDFMASWVERNHCPVNDELCRQAVWLSQHVLLGARTEMERIAAGVANVRKKSRRLAS